MKTNSVYAYVRSKQKVQDKVDPLEGSDENIITEGFLMAGNLNEYFTSVFTREDISALPVGNHRLCSKGESQTI